MTFYNVLAALLFLGALRVLLLALDTSNWADVVAAGCLTTLVFNDMLATSNSIESEKQPYTYDLMVLDLLNFLLLALATVVINPTKNIFDIPLPTLAGWLGRNSFWLLLTCYWILLIVWTHVAWKPKGQLKMLILQSTVWAVFFIEWFVGAMGWNQAAWVGSIVVLIYLVLYLFVIRRFAWADAT